MQSAKKWVQTVRSKPKRPDLIEELLPDGNEFMLLAGRTGIGKTNLVLQIAYCLATGTPFFGLKCTKTVVGYIGFEGTDSKLADRLEKIGANFPDPAGYLRFQHDTPFILSNKLDYFRKSVPGCRVVILDPLRYLVGRDYCKPKDAVAFLGMLQNELAKLKLTAIICHHIKKPNPNLIIEPGDIYDLKGATEYVDAATSVLILERKRQGHKPGGGFARVESDLVTLHFAKTRDAVGELQPIDLKLNRDKLLFEEVIKT